MFSLILQTKIQLVFTDTETTDHFYVHIFVWLFSSNLLLVSHNVMKLSGINISPWAMINLFICINYDIVLLKFDITYFVCVCRWNAEINLFM